MSDGTQQPEIGRRWGLLFFLAMMVFMAHFNRQSIAVAGSERLIDQYGLTNTQMGYVYSAFLLMYTLFMVPGGWLIDRIGAVKTLGLMGLTFGIFEALTGVVSMFPTATSVMVAFILIRGIAGMTSSPLHPGASRVVSRWMPLADQPFANSIVTASAMFGICSTYKLFGGMMDEFGWPSAFLIAGGMTLAVTIIWISMASEFPRTNTSDAAFEPQTAPAPKSDGDAASVTNGAGDSSDEETSFWELLTNRNLICLTISYAAVGYFQYMFFYWIEHYYEDVLKLSVEKSRTYSTISLLAMAAGMLLGGFATRHLTALNMRVPAIALIPIVGMLISGFGIIPGGLSTDPDIALLWFMLALGAIGMCEGPMWTLAIRMGRRYGGTAGGIFNAGGNIGGIIAPVLTPDIGERFGWNAALWIATAFCMVGAIMWIWIDVDDKRGATPNDE